MDYSDLGLFFLYKLCVFSGEDVVDEDDEDEVVGEDGVIWFLLNMELRWVLGFLGFIGFVEEGEVYK